VPYVQYTESMEAPAGGRRDDWWILSRLLQTAGLPSPLDALPDACDASTAIQGILAARGLTIDAMRESPHNTVTFTQEPRESVFKSCLHHPDQKIDCFPALFTEAGLFDRCEAIFEEVSAESSDTLRLIGLRTTHMHNTWQSNVEMFRRGRQQINPLNICEADAMARGLHDGDAVRISTSHGSIQTRVLINNDLRPGAVAMSHGYGHEDAYSLQVASARPGANINALGPIGTGTAEPLSNMSWLSALPVHIERIEPGSAG
jgi:anaerobic selenocysteine-containing dehydrogenase